MAAQAAEQCLLFLFLLLMSHLLYARITYHHHTRKKVKKAVRNISQQHNEKNEGTEDYFISSLA